MTYKPQDFYFAVQPVIDLLIRLQGVEAAEELEESLRNMPYMENYAETVRIAKQQSEVKL